MIHVHDIHTYLRYIYMYRTYIHDIHDIRYLCIYTYMKLHIHVAIKK